MRAQHRAQRRFVLRLRDHFGDLAHRQSSVSRAADEACAAHVFVGILAVACGSTRRFRQQAAPLVEAKRGGRNADAARGLSDVEGVVASHLYCVTANGRATVRLTTGGRSIRCLRLTFLSGQGSPFAHRHFRQTGESHELHRRRHDLRAL